MAIALGPRTSIDCGSCDSYLHAVRSGCCIPGIPQGYLSCARRSGLVGCEFLEGDDEKRAAAESKSGEAQKPSSRGKGSREEDLEKQGLDGFMGIRMHIPQSHGPDALIDHNGHGHPSLEKGGDQEKEKGGREANVTIIHA